MKCVLCICCHGCLFAGLDAVANRLPIDSVAASAALSFSEMERMSRKFVSGISVPIAPRAIVKAPSLSLDRARLTVTSTRASDRLAARPARLAAGEAVSDVDDSDYCASSSDSEQTDSDEHSMSEDSDARPRLSILMSDASPKFAGFSESPDSPAISFPVDDTWPAGSNFPELGCENLSSKSDAWIRSVPCDGMPFILYVDLKDLKTYDIEFLRQGDPASSADALAICCNSGTARCVTEHISIMLSRMCMHDVFECCEFRATSFSILKYFPEIDAVRDPHLSWHTQLQSMHTIPNVALILLVLFMYII